MAYIRTQVQLDRVGGKSEDVITNTFHWEDDSSAGGDPDAEGNLDGVLNRIKTFYQTLRNTVLSSLVAGTGVIKVYNMNDLPDLFPIREEPFVLTGATNAPLPAEVAIALSFNAARAAGVPVGRTRGRVFLGPIRQDVLESFSNSPDAKITPTAQGNILQAAEIMATGLPGTYRLAVFSPTIHGGINGNLPAAFNDVVRFTLDNAFDSVRSRGGDPTARNQATVGGDAAITPV